MSHAEKADKLLIKPTAGARPAPPRTRRQFIPKARTRRPVTRRVTRGTATTRLATAPDRPTPRVLPSPELLSRLRIVWQTREVRVRLIGYWRGESDDHSPDPRDFVDETWDDQERDLVA